MEHADARRDGFLGRAKVHRPPVQANFAGIVGLVTREDFHEGGLAGTVLTQHSVNSAAGDRERDAVIGADRAKVLDDADQFDIHAPYLYKEIGNGVFSDAIAKREPVHARFSPGAH